MKLVLIGPQGSGKGTQAKVISQEFKIPHISTGDLFRENIADNTVLGKRVKEIINRGELVPDSIVVDMLKSRLNEKDAKKGYILDGYPRNLEQIKMLEKITKIDAALLIDVNDKISIRRISSRRQCRKCGKIYSIELHKNIKKCECGSELYQREDDKEEAVKKRLQQYHEKTKPVLKYYEKQKMLISIDGDQSVDQVSAGIISALKSFRHNA